MSKSADVGGVPGTAKLSLPPTEECIYQNPGQSSLGFETDCLRLWHFSTADIVGIRIFVIMIPMDARDLGIVWNGMGRRVPPKSPPHLLSVFSSHVQL